MKDAPSGWAEATFGTITVNRDGSRVPVKASDRAVRRGSYRYFGAQGVIDYIDDYLFDGTYLLIAEDGANLVSRTQPIAEIATGQFWVNNHAHVVESVNGISLKFLKHFINGNSLNGAIRGTAQPKLTQADLNRLCVPLPPRPEQDRIVAAIEEQFSRLDAGIAALERVQRNLKQLRTAVLEKALDTDWPQRQLGDVCLSVTDGDHQAPPQTASGVPFLVIGNVRTGKIDFAGCRHVPLSYYEGLDTKRRPQRDDVLYTVVGSYGISAQIKNDDIFCVQRHIAILRPSPEIDARYLEQVLRTNSARRQADACATGTAQMTVPLSGLRRIHIPVPSLDEQRRIAAELEGHDGLIAHLSAEIQQSSRRSVSLRSSILAAAFCGQLVAQDPTDEPASVLVERIVSERLSSNGYRRTRTPKRRTSQEKVTP